MDNCKILVIDDDRDDVEILVNAFNESGVDAVHHVPTALEAFIHLETVQRDCLPKLIITDNFLPGITGKEFLADLKEMEKYSHIPVVVLSTSKSDAEIEAYSKMGALDYLVKPTSYDEYVEVAHEIKRKLAL